MITFVARLVCSESLGRIRLERLGSARLSVQKNMEKLSSNREYIQLDTGSSPIKYTFTKIQDPQAQTQTLVNQDTQVGIFFLDWPFWVKSKCFVLSHSAFLWGNPFYHISGYCILHASTNILIQLWNWSLQYNYCPIFCQQSRAVWSMNRWQKKHM